MPNRTLGRGPTYNIPITPKDLILIQSKADNKSPISINSILNRPREIFENLAVINYKNKAYIIELNEKNNAVRAFPIIKTKGFGTTLGRNEEHELQDINQQLLAAEHQSKYGNDVVSTDDSINSSEPTNIVRFNCL